jgi:hypothetical protein
MIDVDAGALTVGRTAAGDPLRPANGRLRGSDHLIPVSMYPTNELWNLVPSSPSFNLHVKRDRMPTAEGGDLDFPDLLSKAVARTLLGKVAETRNLARFESGERPSSEPLTPVASAPDPTRLAEGHAAQAAAYGAYAAHYPLLAARRVLHEAACAAGTVAEAASQAALVRCIFGDPLHPTSVAPECLTPAVRQLVRALYEERRFEDLPVLADALEEAGCTDQGILTHCRGPGPHVRDC